MAHIPTPRRAGTWISYSVFVGREARALCKTAETAGEGSLDQHTALASANEQALKRMASRQDQRNQSASSPRSRARAQLPLLVDRIPTQGSATFYLTSPRRQAYRRAITIIAVMTIAPTTPRSRAKLEIFDMCSPR